MSQEILSILIIGTWFAGAVLAVDPPTVTASQMQQYDGVAEGDRVRFIGICTVETPRYGYSITVACDPGGGEWAAIDVYDGVEQRLVAERGQMVKRSEPWLNTTTRQSFIVMTKRSFRLSL